MRPLSGVLAGFVLVLACQPYAVDAILCYVCPITRFTNATSCNDPFKNGAGTKFNCSSTNYCVKRTLVVDGVTTGARGCGVGSTFGSAACYDTSPSGSGVERACQCQNDLCNSSGRLSLGAAAALVTVTSLRILAAAGVGDG